MILGVSGRDHKGFNQGHSTLTVTIRAAAAVKLVLRTRQSGIIDPEVNRLFTNRYFGLVGDL